MTADFEPISIDLAREADFSVGALLVRPSLRQVESGGDSHAGSETLEPRVMQVLVALFQRRGEVVSRDELTRRCWGGRVVGEDAISRAIARVRKLGEARHAFTLETIPRVGYRLMAAEGTAAVHAEETGRAPAPDAASARKSGWLKRPAILAAGVVIAVLAIAAVYLGIRNSRQVEVFPPERIAVLPFEAPGGEPQAREIARGAPGAIVDFLNAQGQRVLSISQTSAYTGEKKAKAAKELDAAYVVDGDVTIANGRLRVTVRISDREGVALGTRVVTRRPEDAGDAANQAAELTANAFGWLGYLPPETTAEMKIAQLRHLQTQFRIDPIGGIDSARDQLKINPNSAVAIANFVITAGNGLYSLPPEDRPALLAELREVQKRAAALVQENTDIVLTDAVVLGPADYAGREQVLRKALADYPDNAQVRGWMTSVLAETGRPEEAILYARQAARLDPTSPVKATTEPRLQVTLGHADMARTQAETELERFPESFVTATALFQVLVSGGDLKAAGAMLDDPELRDRIDPPAGVRPSRVLLAALETKRPREIDALASDCGDPSLLAPQGKRFCLFGLAWLGRVDAVFALMDAIYPEMRGATLAERDARWLADPDAVANLSPWLFDWRLAKVREDKRIIPVFERLGLADFWKSSGKWPDFCKAEPKSVCAQIKSAAR